MNHLSTRLASAHATWVAWRTVAWRRVRDEAGEGVISVAIAVLVMALLGAAMWIAFQQMFGDATDRTQEQVDLIGGSGGGS